MRNMILTEFASFLTLYDFTLVKLQASLIDVSLLSGETWILFCLQDNMKDLVLDKKRLESTVPYGGDFDFQNFEIHVSHVSFMAALCKEKYL